MYASTDGKTILDGFTVHEMALFKRGENEIDYGAFYVSDGNGGVLGTMAIALVDEVVAYLIATESLSSICNYDFTGTTAPPNTKVYISEGFEHGSIDALKRNVIASCVSNDAGEFVMSNIPGVDGEVSVWICIQHTPR